MILDNNLYKPLKWFNSILKYPAYRPSLAGVHIEDDQMVASDGHRLHAVPTPELLKEGTGKNIKLDKVTQKEIAAHLIEDVTYPDYIRVFPTAPVKAEVCADAKYLQDAVSGFDGDVLIRLRPITEDTYIIEIIGVDEAGYALIMPKRRGDSEPWLPRGASK